MAYAAVSSLEQTIDRLLNSSHISIAQNSSPQIIELLYKEVRSLREALRQFNARRSTVNVKMVKTLEVEIIVAVHKFEDVIEFHVADQFHSQSEEKQEETTNHPPLALFSVDVQEIKQDIDSFIETANKMNKAYAHELCNPSPEENEDACAVRSRIAFDGNESNMVGLSDLFIKIKDQLGENSSQSKGMIFILCGMAGIGKTTLAKKLFHEPSIASHFSRRVFVKIGPKYRLVDILVDILKQLNPGIEETNILNGDELVLLAELKSMVYQSLKKLRYLIVLDDVWNRELISELRELFPEDNNGSRVLLTTRLQQIAEWKKYNVPFLNKKESWDLLRQKVFGEESCSFGLEKAGKKIAENCEGLPLTIITVADILSKAEKTTEYWNKVADDKQDSVYKDAYAQISTILYPSYDYLDQHLKACFLYLGAFPQNHMISLYDMINLWSVEGFRDSETATYPGMVTTFTDGANYYFFELYSQNVVIGYQKPASIVHSQ
ncbi:PREDICTED: putative late blight resistance protein homolog R1A-10 [Erythranthe guttata]|uniref:putative late blight resistance protein homolog R1A-10 n=1 Tax=Erythranthe guttata TaxID=4155 RepID=UPI00064DCA95|nr:PREDICTED: putative late blight resistance protein homolog R1A-10 [Erythranthe guttata]|eukprot:XP_012853794.1 PREDICTED: putative late blight resistance protein homolog R1A-10 [Erythranthe guttata]